MYARRTQKIEVIENLQIDLRMTDPKKRLSKLYFQNIEPLSITAENHKTLFTLKFLNLGLVRLRYFYFCSIKKTNTKQT